MNAKAEVKAEPANVAEAGESGLSLHERVYQEIRQALISGKFAPGQKMTSRGLAAALGTSDMPVRVALGRLVSEGGLVQLVSNGNITVPVISRERFTEVMELRSLLEGRATTLATAHMSRTDIAALKRIKGELSAATKAQDIVKYLEANHRFKFLIYNRCESPVLLSMIENLWLQAGPFLRNLVNRALVSGMTDNRHQEAVKAIESGDAKAAGRALSLDIEEGLAEVLRTAEFPKDGAGFAVKRLQK